MKITITQKNDARCHEELEDACKLFVGVLFPGGTSIHFKIKVQTGVLSEVRTGQLESYYLEDGITVDFENFTIKIYEGLSCDDQIRVLAHEMVHIEQRVSLRLVYKNDAVYWRGEYLGDVERIPYEDKVWEQEAREVEEDIFKLWKFGERNCRR